MQSVNEVHPVYIESRHTVFLEILLRRDFKALFGAVTIRGRCLQRSTRTCVHSFNNKPICMHIKCVCAYGSCCQPLTMRRDFEGGVYWDELADRCGEILRMAGFQGAVRFRGNMVLAINYVTTPSEQLNCPSCTYRSARLKIVP